MNNIAGDPTPTENEPPSEGFGSVAESIGTKNLKIAIVVMPFFFLLVTVVLIAMFGGKDDAADASAAGFSASPSANLVAGAGLEASVSPAVAPLSGGGAIALDGDRLAVRVDGPDGIVVLVYDITTGESIARVPVSVNDTP